VPKQLKVTDHSAFEERAEKADRNSIVKELAADQNLLEREYEPRQASPVQQSPRLSTEKKQATVYTARTCSTAVSTDRASLSRVYASILET
jgi:hypothetical protein